MSRHAAVAVGVIAATGSALLMVSQLPRPYWVDEAFSVFVARQPVGSLVRAAAVDIHPPAYFFTLKLWGSTFGYTEAATGALSLILLLAAVGLVYQLGRRLADRWVGAVAALLLWCSAMAINAATETRMYTLLLVAALVSTLAWYQLTRSGHWTSRWWWVCYLSANLLGVHTHYFYWLLVYAQNIGVVILVRGSLTPLMMRRWVVAQLCLAVAYLPWLSVMVTRLWEKQATANWVPEFSPTFGQVFVAVLGSGAVNVRGLDFFWLTILPPLVVAVMPWVIVAAVVGTLQLGRWSATYRLRRPSPAAVILASSVLIPVAVLAALDIFVTRYLVYVVALLAVAVALLLGRYSRPVRSVLAVMLAVGLVAGNWWYEVRVGPHRTIYQWPLVARYLTQYANSRRTLILTAAFEEEILLRHYYSGPLPVSTFLPSEYAQPDGPTLSRIRRIALANIRPDNVDEVIDLVGAYDTVWTVDGGAWYFADRQGSLRTWLERHCIPEARLEIGPVPLDSAPLLLHRYRTCLRSPRQGPVDASGGL